MGSELPWESLDMNPPACEPHTGMIVQVACGLQFSGEMIHQGHRSFGRLAQVTSPAATMMGALVLTGIVSATFASDPIMVFGSYDLAFANHNLNFFMTVRGIHEFCTNAIIVLILIHIIAAIYHHFILKDNTTSNMSKFWMTKHIGNQK